MVVNKPLDFAPPGRRPGPHCGPDPRGRPRGPGEGRGSVWGGPGGRRRRTLGWFLLFPMKASDFMDYLAAKGTPHTVFRKFVRSVDQVVYDHVSPLSGMLTPQTPAWMLVHRSE